MQWIGLVKPFSRGYNTGSGDTGQYEYISGSSIYRFKGGTGGTLDQFNGTEFYPATVDNIYNVTQSWDESFETKLGIATYNRDDQREFYNGEFSGSSPYVKLQRGLGNEDDPCFATLKINPNQFYVYQLGFYGGPDNDFTITSAPLPSPSPTPTPTPTPSPSPSPIPTYVSNITASLNSDISSIGDLRVSFTRTPDNSPRTLIISDTSPLDPVIQTDYITNAQTGSNALTAQVNKYSSGTTLEIGTGTPQPFVQLIVNINGLDVFDQTVNSGPLTVSHTFDHNDGDVIIIEGVISTD